MCIYNVPEICSCRTLQTLRCNTFNYGNGKLFHIKDITITYVLRNRLGATCASSGKIFGGGTTSTWENGPRTVAALPLKSLPELSRVGLLMG